MQNPIWMVDNSPGIESQIKNDDSDNDSDFG